MTAKRVSMVLLGMALGACGTGATATVDEPTPEPNPRGGGDEPDGTPAPFTLEDLAATADSNATATPCGAATEPAGWVGYVPPPALPWRESLARFPFAAISKAREFNRNGLAARAAGDANAARSAYEEALKHSPRLAPARYNLACEFAREPSRASRDRAIGELETLLMIGSKEARAFVARARFDADFACVRMDPRFAAVQAAIRFDPADIVGRQLCKDPARVADLIDADAGISVHEHIQSAEHSRLDRDYDGQLLGKQAFDKAVKFAISNTGRECEEPLAEGSFVSEVLAGRAGEVRLTADTGTCWGTHNEAWFVRAADGWRLTHLSTGPRLWP